MSSGPNVLITLGLDVATLQQQTAQVVNGMQQAGQQITNALNNANGALQLSPAIAQATSLNQIALAIRNQIQGIANEKLQIVQNAAQQQQQLQQVQTALTNLLNIQTQLNAAYQQQRQAGPVSPGIVASYQQTSQTLNTLIPQLQATAGGLQQNYTNAQLAAQGFNQHITQLKQMGPATGQATNAQNGLGSAFGISHNQMLAFIGVARLLPGELGRSATGAAFLARGLSDAATFAEGATLAVTTIIAVLVRLSQAAIEASEDLLRVSNLARGLGFSVGEMKALDDIMKIAGGSAASFTILVKNFDKALGGAGAQGKAARRQFEALFAGTGIDFNTLKTPADLILAMAKSNQQLGSETTKTTLVQQLAGRGYKELSAGLELVNDHYDDLIKKQQQEGFGSK